MPPDEQRKADEGTADGAASQDGDAGGTSAGSENTDTKPEGQSETPSPDKNTVPRERLNEESKKRKDAEKRLADLEKEKREREEAAEREKGNWQAVAEQKQKRIDELEVEVARLKPIADKVETLETSIKQSLESRVKALPDKIRKMAPENLDALQQWLPDAEELAKDLNGKSNGETKPKDNAARGAGKAPRASKEGEPGELLEKARASQAGFTLRSF